MDDKTYLQAAIKLAEQSLEPVKVACIIVQNGQILAQEVNSQRADEIAVHHAEIKAIYQANQKIKSRQIKGATAYCSCEPCTMCLTALSFAKVERIVFNKTIKQVAPDRSQALIDSYAFVKQLDFVPNLEQLLI